MTPEDYNKQQDRIREITHQNVLRLLGEIGVMKAELTRLSEENEDLRKKVAQVNSQLVATNSRIGTMQARLYQGAATVV